MFFSNMKLGTKLALGFGITLVLMILIAAMGINRMGSINDDMTKIVEIDARKVISAENLINGMNTVQVAVRNLMLTKDETIRAKQYATIDKARTEMVEALDLLSTLVVTPEGKQLIASLKGAVAATKASNGKVLALIRENLDDEAIRVLREEATPLSQKGVEIGMKTVQTAIDASEQSATHARKDYDLSRFLMIGASVFAFLLSGAIAFLLTRSITKPIGRVTEGLTNSADQVASASGQVAASAQGLAEGASEQAAGVEETSASLEDISSMTRQNAQAAKDANQIMHETSKVVSSASDSMQQLTSSMAEIYQASEETQKIIKTIDEISFQTNLLALNAAVEAARAGEAGAGFAVVADEVRNLAMRAAEAAKNTANLIEDTVRKIRDGSEVVDKTNSEFSKVVNSATKMSGLIQEITVASQEQAQGIEQVGKGISEMEQVIQRNASVAEESASASEEMNAQAEQMKLYVLELEAVIRGRNNSSAANARQEAAGAGWLKKEKASRAAASPKLFAATGKARESATSRRGPSSEQVIPFNESEPNDF
ncbi:MAG: methyl-accepting chemotaxis protein [Syntrophobacter sp.]